MSRLGDPRLVNGHAGLRKPQDTSRRIKMSKLTYAKGVHYTFCARDTYPDELPAIIKAVRLVHTDEVMCDMCTYGTIDKFVEAFLAVQLKLNLRIFNGSATLESWIEDGNDLIVRIPRPETKSEWLVRVRKF